MTQVNEDPPPGAAERYRPAYELAAERILELVAERKLAPGNRLPTELELAQELGFGRTVIREAVKILSALGRVRVRKGAGLYVADDAGLLPASTATQFVPANLDHLAMLFEFRVTLDRQAARWAAERATPAQLGAIGAAVQDCLRGADEDDRQRFDTADDAFHHAVVTAAGNMFLASTNDAMRTLQNQSAVLGLRGQLGGSLQEAAQAHADIYAAIQNGQPDEAAAAAERHVRRTWDGYQEEIQRRIFGDLTTQ